ncbi:ATR-interacting protein-like [Antedon mediterranea]|uniref:ATR-interacting protein-like n=1 Tax=Antedon mediterranea TaxID=105859 RepID=UPI003AF63AE6
MSANSSTWNNYRHDRNIQTNINHGSAPFPKRQRLMTGDGTDEIDEFTEDDDDFTSEDFLAMDELASQALTQNTNSSKSKLQNEKTPLKKCNSNRENAPSPYNSKVYYHQHYPRSVSSKSIPFEGKSQKVYPVQTNIPFGISGKHSKTQKGAPVSKTNMARGTTASLTPPADQSTNNGLSEVSVESHSVSFQEFENIKRELEKTKSEMKTLQSERFGKDGEIKVLRQNQTKLNTELNRIHLERIEKEQVAKMQRTEREKELQTQLEKLKTEMHFKNQELLETQSLYKLSEMKQQKANGLLMSPTSPRRSQRRVKVKSPGTPKGFPTCRSFMAKDGDADTTEKMSTNDTVEKDEEKTKGPTLPLSYRACSSDKMFTGNYCGARLLKTVLERPASSAYTDNNNFNTGLVTLLNPTTTRLDQCSMKKDNVSSTGRLTSLREDTVKKFESSLSVYSENVDLALRTVIDLLNSTTTSTDDNLNTSEKNTAIQLLPSLEHHLTLYVDHLDKPFDIPTSSTTLTSTSSLNTRSLDMYQSSSMTSKDFSLTCLEDNVLSALVVLQKLVGCCDAVANKILAQDLLEVPLSISTIDFDVSAPLISQSGTCKSTISVHDSSSGLNFVRSHIFKKLVRLICIQQKACQHSKIMEEALKLLVILTRRCEKSMLIRFKVLLIEEPFPNLLDLDITFEQVHLVLDLLVNLAANFDLAKTFCNQKDSCLLLKLYEYAVYGLQDFSLCQITLIRSKVFKLLSSVIFGHSLGLKLLSEANCRCSLQLVKTVILTLDKEYRELSTTEDYLIRLAFLRQGIVLLHTLSFNDQLFHEHRIDVEHYYVHLITGLSKLFKQSDVIPDQEVYIVEELWDFDQSDDNEWEQEGDYEAQTDMDVS